MLTRLGVPSATGSVVRPTVICVVGVAVAAYAIGRENSATIAMCLGVLLVLIAILLVCQVWRLVKVLRHASADVSAAAGEAERHYVDVLQRIMKFVEAREQYAQGHSHRVGQLAEQIAAKLGLDSRRQENLALAGQLHDIGLLAIPDGILNKHARFGVEDFRTVQKHSEISYEILKPLESLAAILPAVRHHHERMNGTGYPAGIAGGEIPLGARILAVADSYDAMTHDRPYRRAMGALATVRELYRCTPAGYDRQCVEALAEVVNLPGLELAAAPEAIETR